ncbi:hypothetical protein DPSP01_008136 [Paraphaeosphaeria sporulosa]
MLEYGERCDIGPQHPDLWAKNKEGQRKQIEYFTHKLQQTLLEHSTTERRKYRLTQDYVKRAEKWTVSEPADIVAVEPPSLEDDHPQGEIMEPSLRKRNAERRSLAAESWPASSPERRLVYPPDFATTYMSYVPITSGAAYGRCGIVEDFARIETWIGFTARNARYSANRGSEDEYNRLWLDRKSCSDIIRISIIDSATTVDSVRKTRMIETMLLLAHHPHVGVTEFISDGMSCCNKSVGLTSLIKSVAVPFIYLNILWLYVDGNPSSPLLQPREQLQHYAYGYYRNSTFVTLLPRPAYMNTQSFNNMMATVLEEHGHVVEHVFFNPLLAPYDSGRRSKYLKLSMAESQLDTEDLRRERDVFTDLPMLKEALKGMWKILVSCDMLFKEIGKPVNWEYVVIESMSLLFQDKGGFERLMGTDWMDYELARNKQESFGFYAAIDAEVRAS